MSLVSSGFLSFLGLSIPIFGFTLPRLRHSSWTWDIQTNLDPRTFPTPAPIGTSCRDTSTGKLYMKTGPGPTDWTLLGSGGVDPTLIAYFYDDFLNAQSLVTIAGNALAPALAVVGDTSSVALVDNTDVDASGILELTAFDSGGGAASAYVSVSGGVRAIKFGSPNMAPASVEWRVKPDGTPSGGNDFNLALGMSSQVPLDGGGAANLLFLCGFAFFGNGNWWVTTKSQPFTNVNCVDTGVPVSPGSWTRLKTVAVNGDLQEFYIDDTLVASLTDDLEGASVGVVAEIAIDPGGNFHRADLDYVLCSQQLDRT